MIRKTLTLIPLTILLAVALGNAGEKHDVFSVPSVEPEGSEPQPVDVMNWLIDENGNLKVSNQVRSLMHELVDQVVVLTPDSDWRSAWVDAAWANSIRARMRYVWRDGASITCRMEWEWPDEAVLGGYVDQQTRAFSIDGPRTRVFCQCTGTPSGSCDIEVASVWLRAE